MCVCVADSFVQEAIRMASGVFVVRKVIEDTPFTMPDGKTFVVRQGDRVAMYPPATNMDPDVFENPEVSKQLVVGLISTKTLHSTLWFLFLFIFMTMSTVYLL